MSVRCGFYLSNIGQIDDSSRQMRYDRDFIRLSGGSCETLLELREVGDLSLVRQMFLGGESFRTWTRSRNISLSREIHMTDDAALFTGSESKANSNHHFMLCEGKTIHQFTDFWQTAPRYTIAADRLAKKSQTLEGARHFRAACREIAAATNERTAIAAMLPPGVLCGHTINVERRPARRPNAVALILVGLMNSFPFDWLLRQKAASHVSLYLLAELPVPKFLAEVDRFLAHGTLRLSCNHQEFAPLWHEQLGSSWREGTCRHSWPAIAKEPDRWQLRAAMDALVAQAYGLDRAQYERILGSFSHRSCKAAPALCLAAFDDLADSGLVQFCRQHDSYADIALVTSIAEPAESLAALTP